LGQPKDKTSCKERLSDTDSRNIEYFTRALCEIWHLAPAHFEH
jgi:hypothetical protein